MVSYMDAMFSCIFNVCGVRMRIAITSIVPGATSGVLLKKSWFLRVVFIGGKSVKEEIKRQNVSCSSTLIMDSLSDHQCSNLESCIWRTVTSDSSHHPREVLRAM